MQRHFFGLLLIILTGCNQTVEQKHILEKFIIQTDSVNVEDIESNKYCYNTFGTRFLFKDNKYIITNCDMGEWGASVFFTDSLLKIKTAFRNGRIHSFGKTDSTYLFFALAGHGSPLLTMIKDPSKLPRLSDTLKFCGQWERFPDLDNAAKQAGKNSDIVIQIDDFNDSILNVGVFTKGKDIYLIQSDDPIGNKKNKMTYLSRLGSDLKTFTILDTLLIYPTFGLSDITTLLYREKQFIGFGVHINHTLRRGYFIVSGDTITISYLKNSN